MPKNQFFGVFRWTCQNVYVTLACPLEEELVRLPTRKISSENSKTKLKTKAAMIFITFS